MIFLFREIESTLIILFSKFQDFESVLFLISINVNVHSRTQDQHGLTPLLLSVQKGHSMIVRNLILAGASVHDKTPSQQTALQLAAESNLAEVCGILLSEGIDYAAVDSRYLFV